MTAEVAILNKSGVAVAADSAVTRGRNKVHISANKIFQLHKTMPIGIVVYNHADIFGLPWELVAKTYREQVHDRKFGKQEEVCDDFLAFLHKPALLTPSAMEHDVVHTALYLFDRLAGIKGSGNSRSFREFMEKYLALPDKQPLGNFARDYSLNKFRRNFGEHCRIVCEDRPFVVSAANKSLFVKCVHDFLVHRHRLITTRVLLSSAMAEPRCCPLYGTALLMGRH